MILPLVLFGSAVTISAAQGSSERVKLHTSERTVNFGERFALGGGVPGERGASLRVQFRANGSDGWRLIRKVHTDERGHYGVHTHARASGAYRAVSGNGRSSAPAPVDVRSAVSFHVGSHNVVLGHSVALSSAVRPGGERALEVVVKGRDHRVIGGSTSDAGGFSDRFTPVRTGVYSLRALTGPNAKGTGGSSPRRRVTVYRYAAASWYGPGLYGNALGCGGTLRYGMIGVANKTLPCGTKVRLRYHGRTVVAPVIDRGPYAAGRDYDLTEATKNALGFPDVGTVLASR